MKNVYLILILIFVIFQTSCDATPDDNKTEISVMMKDTLANVLKTDFSDIEISDDSLDLELFNMMLQSHKYKESELLKNIEQLIGKGANPNVSIEYQYSVRKLGTYIPIVKHFYNNKYRHYTTSSTAFLEAINTKNIAVVEKFIEMNADVNKASKVGVYPLNLAISLNCEDIVDLLLKNKCDVSITDLSLSKNLDLIEKLVKLGADNQTININFALNNGENLKRLIKLHPNVNKYPLDYQIIFTNDTLLSYLLKTGLNDKSRGVFPDECPLIYGAVKYGDLQTVKILKQGGIDVLANCNSINDKILFLVINSQKKDILNYYLNTLKISPNTKDWTNKSALLVAVETNNDEMIKMLLKAGANIEYNGYFNKTPLMHAVQYNKYISAETLLNEGANVNYKNKYGETPLTVAIQQKDYAMIKLLVGKGADAKIKYKNQTLSEYAVDQGAPNMIIEYLKSNE